MLKIPGCDTIWRPEDFQGIDQDLIAGLPRPKKRITELMLKSVNENKKGNNIKVILYIVFIKHSSPFIFTCILI